MPSSPPLLHTAMPTPCLMLFGIVIPTVYIQEMFFCLVSVIFFGHLSSLKTDNSTQPLPTEKSGEFDSLQLLVA